MQPPRSTPRRLARSRSGRAQSEVIGSLLFTGVVILLVSLVGLVVLSGADTTSEPAVDLEIAVENATVRLTHAGGEDLPASDVRVVLGADDDGSEGLENFTEAPDDGDGDGLFEGGERRAHGHGAGDVLAVTVVHEPSGTVLAMERTDVPDAP